MRRRYFLLGAILAPVAAALRLGGEELKIASTPGSSVPFTEFYEGVAVKRSTATWQPLKWYEVGDTLEIEGKLYEITKTETRSAKFGESTVYVGDAYLRELKQDLVPKADYSYALNRYDSLRFEYPFERS